MAFDTPRCHQATYTLAQLRAQGAASIAPEERERIGRFVFACDAKLAMAGRLLIRRAVRDALGVEAGEVVLGRTKERKPYLVAPW
jgi:phosphopantetheinyl transferase